MSSGPWDRQPGPPQKNYQAIDKRWIDCHECILRQIAAKKMTVCISAMPKWYYKSHCSCGTAGQQVCDKKWTPPYPYPSCGKNYWSKRGLLNLPNTISILPLIFLLMTPIKRLDRGTTIARCIWVKKPHIKKGTLTSSSKSSSMNIGMGFILLVSSHWNNSLAREML